MGAWAHGHMAKTVLPMALMFFFIFFFETAMALMLEGRVAASSKIGCRSRRQEDLGPVLELRDRAP